MKQTTEGDGNDIENSAEDSPLEKQIHFEFGSATVVLIGSRRKGNAREDSDYDFVICPESGPIHYFANFWGLVSVEVMEQVGWYQGVQEVETKIREQFSIPQENNVDVFLAISKNNRITLAKLEWDDSHECLKGWIEDRWFEEVRPLIERYL